MVKVSIVAPTPLGRAGLRSMLASEEIEVVDESATFDRLNRDVEGTEVIILANERLLQAIPQVESAQLALLVLSDDERLAARLQTLPLKGWGLLPSDTASEALRAATLAVASGLVVLPHARAGNLLNQPGVTPLVALQQGAEEALTARELEVLQLLSQGLSNKLIARQLQISEHTVKFHVSSLFNKLEASSRADAISRGARRGLITF
ncbi:MAG TPA: response regulator transcription factor [Chloroflexia bacterium]|nr:response regulator transcription factor [Chloroflexia bacterium]